MAFAFAPPAVVRANFRRGHIARYAKLDGYADGVAVGCQAMSLKHGLGWSWEKTFAVLASLGWHTNIRKGDRGAKAYRSVLNREGWTEHTLRLGEWQVQNCVARDAFLTFAPMPKRVAGNHIALMQKGVYRDHTNFGAWWVMSIWLPPKRAFDVKWTGYETFPEWKKRRKKSK